MPWIDYCVKISIAYDPTVKMSNFSKLPLSCSHKVSALWNLWMPKFSSGNCLKIILHADIGHGDFTHFWTTLFYMCTKFFFSLATMHVWFCQINKKLADIVILHILTPLSLPLSLSLSLPYLFIFGKYFSRKLLICVKWQQNNFGGMRIVYVHELKNMSMG